MTSFLMLPLKYTIGLRASQITEVFGADLIEHGIYGRFDHKNGDIYDTEGRKFVTVPPNANYDELESLHKAFIVHNMSVFLRLKNKNSSSSLLSKLGENQLHVPGSPKRPENGHLIQSTNSTQNTSQNGAEHRNGGHALKAGSLEAKSEQYIGPNNNILSTSENSTSYHSFEVVIKDSGDSLERKRKPAPKPITDAVCENNNNNIVETNIKSNNNNIILTTIF